MLARQAAAKRRVCHLRRREDQHPCASAQASHSAPGSLPRHARRERVRARRSWAYLAALDVHLATVVGRCESTTGIMPFFRLVEPVMTRKPYNDARRVFWVVDNGGSHRGRVAAARLQQQFPRPVLVHTLSTPVGSTRSRSSSRSSNSRSSHPTTSPASTNSPSAPSASNTMGSHRSAFRMDLQESRSRTVPRQAQAEGRSLLPQNRLVS